MTLPFPTRHANQNVEHEMFKEFYVWQKKIQWERKIPRDYFKTSFANRHQMLANFIWFFKFEYDFAQKSAEIRRKEMRSVE